MHCRINGCQVVVVVVVFEQYYSRILVANCRRSREALFLRCLGKEVVGEVHDLAEETQAPLEGLRTSQEEKR